MQLNHQIIDQNTPFQHYIPRLRFETPSVLIQQISNFQIFPNPIPIGPDSQFCKSMNPYQPSTPPILQPRNLSIGFIFNIKFNSFQIIKKQAWVVYIYNCQRVISASKRKEIKLFDSNFSTSQHNVDTSFHLWKESIFSQKTPLKLTHILSKKHVKFRFKALKQKPSECTSIREGKSSRYREAEMKVLQK